MDDSLPAALVHLREAEIVRLCGLTRAALGQDHARAGRVRQAERAAGTLRAVVQEGETSRAVQARFSESGLDAWTCDCSPAASVQPLSSPNTGSHPPCEHVAALLSLWVREPGQFRGEARAAGAMPTGAPVPSAGEHPSVSGAAEAHAVTASPVSALSEPEPPAPSVPVSSAPIPSLDDLEQLDGILRRLLNLVALAGGRVTMSEMQHLFARQSLGEPEAALPALERLREAGFMQPVLMGASSRHAEADAPAGWAIPETVLAILPRVVPLESLPEPQAPELREQRAEAALPRLLTLVAALVVDRGGPEPPAAASQSQVSRSVLELDAALAGQWAPRLKTTPEQVRFCLALLRLLGLLPQAQTAYLREHRSAGLALPMFSREQARETLLRAYRLLLSRPEVEVTRDLFTQWLHAQNARELVELRDAGVRVAWLGQRETRHAPALAAENQGARQYIVDLLRWVPAGRWWSFRSFVEFVWRFQPGFLRGRQQTFLRPQWWLERLPEGQSLAMDVHSDWRQAEGRYIALLMRRALYWLGVVDLALDEQGRLKGFRITEPGAILLGAAPKGESAPAAAKKLPAILQAQDDGALTLPLDGLQPEQLEMLLWWCEPAGASGEALRLRPSAERFAAALDAGQDLAAWRAWLEEQPQGAALTALVGQIDHWATLYGQVRVYESVTMLEVADAALLHELEATLDMSAQYVDHALASGLAVLRPDAVEALIEALRRRGYSPWVIDHEASDRP